LHYTLNQLNPTRMKLPLPHSNHLLLAAALSGLALAAPTTACASSSAALNLFQAAGPIKGQVVDESGAGLPGVNVIVKGGNSGTQTDAAGFYSIQAPADAVLVFSFVGSRRWSKLGWVS
jgi:hypothetical protein